ncbi:DUF1634 domain-containing protein [Myroides indicus]|nr:DUF1634 domain-containing protein [Myroides indicus]
MMSTKFTDKDLQIIIGNVLRYGVWLALTVALIGGFILLLSSSEQTIDFQNFTIKDNNLFEVFNAIIAGVKQGNGEAIIFLGIIFLFLTPALRLVLSLISFFLEKDRLYVFITLIVIGIIVLSVSFGFSH